MGYRTLRNTGASPIWVVIGNSKYTIEGHKEENYEDGIADKFLEQHDPVVVDVSVKAAGGAVYAPDLIQNTVWVANMTGNPDAPEKIKVRRYDKTLLRLQMVETTNINKEPRAYSAELKGGHKQYFDEAGLVQISLPSKKLSVPPYSRRPFQAGEAHWLLQRDAMNEQRGAVIESRAPSDFEPDMNWRLNDMQAYAKLVDSEMDLGINEELLAKKLKGDATDEKKATEELRKVKQQLLRRLYFRIADPKYRLPTKKEFNEFVTGKSEDQLAKEELEQLMQRAEHENKKQPQTLGQQKLSGGK